MAEIGKHPCPIMRSVRGFHADIAADWRRSGLPHRNAASFAGRLFRAVDAVNLEDILRKIQTYSNDLHDILLRCNWRSRFHRAGGGVHTIGSCRWLMWGLRAAMPKRSSFAVAQFDTRLRLIKIAARVVEIKTQIRLHLPTSCPDQRIMRIVLSRIPQLAT